jgi:signal peptidase II
VLRARTKAAVAAPILAAALVLDQLTKWLALRALGDGTTVPLVPTVELDLVYNNGFSFGTGAGYGRLVASGVILVCCVLAVLIVRAQTLRRLSLLSIVLGGALGNLVDRALRADRGLLTGEVVDFVDVSWYAVFNLADSLVVVGSLALVVSEALAGRHGDAPAGAPGAADRAGIPNEPSG